MTDDDSVNVEDIGGQPNSVLPPDDLASKELDNLAKENKFKAELGLAGKALGGRQEKPGNISGIVIILCFLLISALLLTDCGTPAVDPVNAVDAGNAVSPINADPGYEKSEILTALFGIITLTLGYLFGSNTKD